MYMVEPKLKRMLWEGIAIGRVRDMNNNLRQDVITAVAEMFEDYPFRAGQ